MYTTRYISFFKLLRISKTFNKHINIFFAIMSNSEIQLKSNSLANASIALPGSVFCSMFHKKNNAIFFY